MAKTSFRAKLKKTGPNCKGFPKGEGYFCETGKTRGLLSKTTRLSRGGGSDLSDQDPTVGF
jgi:hypothetical protein